MPSKQILSKWEVVLNWVKYLCDVESKNKMRRCLFECFCWKHFDAQLWDIKSWQQKSCWCYNIASLKSKTWVNNPLYKHWMRKKSIYNVRRCMKERCYNKKHKYYLRYWGRWIGICERWIYSFENFLSDMWEPTPWNTLDRIDNNWNYCKENCRRATREEQMVNKSNSIYINDINLKQFASSCGIKLSTLKYHFYKETLNKFLSSKWIQYVNSYHKWYKYA